MMHASHATNWSHPSLCTTNLRHIYFPHILFPHLPTPTLLTRAHAHTRLHMRVTLLSPHSHLPLPTSHCFPRVTHNRSLHSLSRSPTLCVLDDVTALAHSLTHSLRARRRHCTRPLAHPRATCSKTLLHSPTRSPLATCSKTSLHSPTRSPTHCVIDDVTTLTTRSLTGNQTRRRLFGEVQRCFGRSRVLVDYGERRDSDSSA